MNYKTLLLGTAVIMLATYAVYATVNPGSQTNDMESNLGESQEQQNDSGIKVEAAEGQVFQLDTINNEDADESENVETETGYTLVEVSTHSTESDCWTAVNGVVYDLTSFIAKHPGGKSNIMKICGIDGTSTFEGQHGGDNKPENTLAGLEIGLLK